MAVVPQKLKIVGTSLGKLRYDGPEDEAFQIHAADDVQLKFTYTADQRIQDGQLKLTIPTADGWTSPQDLTTGQERLYHVLMRQRVRRNRLNLRLQQALVTVDIVDLAPDETIIINYGCG